jgi:hypothetical protein
LVLIFYARAIVSLVETDDLFRGRPILGHDFSCGKESNEKN